MSDIKFNWDEMKWKGISVDNVILWERLYPDVDVVKVIKFDSIQWLEKVKGTKKANKKNWHKFLCNWLKREQEKGVGR